MVEMASRSPFPMALITSMLVLSAAPDCHADIGFAQAATTARLLNPGRPLVSLRHRLTNQGGQYNTGCVNPECTLLYGVDLSDATGAVVGTGVEAVAGAEAAAMRAVLERSALMTIDFADALARARSFTGRQDSLVRRCDLNSELFMLFFDIRYADNMRLMVDAISGQIVPVADTAGQQNSITTAAYLAALDRAMGVAAEHGGGAWVPVMGENAATQGGIATGITLLNAANGHLLQVDMLGKATDALEFSPIGHLAAVVEGIRATMPQVVVTAPQFTERLESSYPGCLVSAISLQAQIGNAPSRTTWSANILTALGQPLEFAIDATVPAQRALGVATVPQLFKAGDYNRDGHVTGEDLAELLAMFNTSYPPDDLDQDGWVKGEDLAILLGNWG